MELELTWRRSFRFWWAMFWRGWLCQLTIYTIIFIVCLMIYPFVHERFEMTWEAWSNELDILQWIVSIVAPIYVLKKFILGKRIGDFVAVLVDPDQYQPPKLSEPVAFQPPAFASSLTKDWSKVRRLLGGKVKRLTTPG